MIDGAVCDGSADVAHEFGDESGDFGSLEEAEVGGLHDVFGGGGVSGDSEGEAEGFGAVEFEDFGSVADDARVEGLIVCHFPASYR